MLYARRGRIRLIMREHHLGCVMIVMVVFCGVMMVISG